MPNALLALLKGHRDLGVHTELLSDGVIDLVESGVVTGTQKTLRRGKIVTTLALGSKRLYDFLHENPAVDFAPVEWVNDPRVIAREPNFVAINATTEVDFYGQCASETVAGKYYSSSGGQYDFSRGAMYSEGGQGFIVLQATTRDGSMSKIRPTLTPGSVVTTSKNTVDKIVTEFGVAEMRGRTVRQRAEALISIAAPRFREELTKEAKAMAII
jgi:acyl-CoA hydrolase